ncbi:hypothetical protein B296_00032638, partial [Ensete ventricosum]
SSNHMPPLSFSGMLGGVQKSNPGVREPTPKPYKELHRRCNRKYAFDTSVKKCGSYFLFLSFLQPIGKAVGDWYFGRSSAVRKIDCPYPCNSSCRNVAKDFMEE